MIADHQYRPTNSAQVFTAINARPPQQKYSGTQQQVMHRKANPGDRPAQHPARIVEFRAGSNLALQRTLQIADGFESREAGLVEIGLIAIFERAEQFHAIERSEVQVRLEVCVGRKIRGTASGASN